MEACRSGNAKGDILGQDTMKLVMWDMLRADEYFTRLSLHDSTGAKKNERFRLYQQVFDIHHITKGKFDTSYLYYAAHPVAYKLLIDSLETFAARERAKVFNFGQGH
jgi:hypothetical protein